MFPHCVGHQLAKNHYLELSAIDLVKTFFLTLGHDYNSLPIIYELLTYY